MFGKFRSGPRHVIQTRCAGFSRDEGGSFIIFSLFLIVGMLICVGIGVDVMRYEVQRTLYQNTADRAVLAAASVDVANDPNRDPEAIVHDYFARFGLPPEFVTVSVTPSANGNTVTAETTPRVPTMLLKLVGLTQISGPAPATATETVSDVEVVLVLDNSGSMGDGNKLPQLKSAAKQFVDDVIQDTTGQGAVSISLVPFATQVNAGDLADYYALSNEHDLSSCVTFEENDFAVTALPTTQPLIRTAHFDATNERHGLDDRYMVCRPTDERRITPWSTDKTQLKSQIDAMTAWGWTSIELGAKWGAALLDPAARPVVDSRILAGVTDAAASGMPFDYNRPQTSKFLVVMSDGANTNQWDVKEGFRQGPSHVWKKTGGNAEGNPRHNYYVYDAASDRYLDTKDKTWETAITDAEQMTWQQVWEEMSVKFYGNHLAKHAFGGTWQDHYDAVVWKANPTAKNIRTSKICKAARDAGVTVFTIGVGTYGQGDATLEDCAGGSTNFFDISADEMDQAFGAIARQINQLRLTQ